MFWRFAQVSSRWSQLLPLCCVCQRTVSPEFLQFTHCSRGKHVGQTSREECTASSFFLGGGTLHVWCCLRCGILVAPRLNTHTHTYTHAEMAGSRAPSPRAALAQQLSINERQPVPTDWPWRYQSPTVLPLCLAWSSSSPPALVPASLWARFSGTNVL